MTHATSITAPTGLPFIDIVREFDAPTEAVFRAHTDPSLFARWTGGPAMRMDDLELHASRGGSWHYSFRGAGEACFSFFGVFHTVERNRLIVQTFEFNLAPGLVGISSTSFDVIDGRTRVSLHEVYASVEARDAALASGMEHGVRAGYEQLDKILAA